MASRTLCGRVHPHTSTRHKNATTVGGGSHAGTVDTRPVNRSCCCLLVVVDVVPPHSRTPPIRSRPRPRTIRPVPTPPLPRGTVIQTPHSPSNTNRHGPLLPVHKPRQARSGHTNRGADIRQPPTNGDQRTHTTDSSRRIRLKRPRTRPLPSPQRPRIMRIAHTPRIRRLPTTRHPALTSHLDPPSCTRTRTLQHVGVPEPPSPEEAGYSSTHPVLDPPQHPVPRRSNSMSSAKRDHRTRSCLSPIDANSHDAPF